MKKRIPFDVEFLLESVMSETPDFVHIRQTDADRLKANGTDVGGPRELAWKFQKTVPFFIAPDDVVVYTNMGTHLGQENFLRIVTLNMTSTPIQYIEQNFYKVTSDHRQTCIQDKYKEQHKVYLYGVTGGLEGAVKYLKENRDFFKRLQIRETENSATVPCGRMWTDKHVISFWNEKDYMEEYMPLIFKFMTFKAMDIKKCVYEFIDHKGFYTYKEVVTDEDTGQEKLSPEEVRALQKIQHLDPDAKKKLAGTNYKDLMMKKMGKGQSFAALANAMVPALEEGNIKLKDLLK